MSIKDKTEQIVENGKAARGEYDPEPGSLPLKAYLFWNKHTKHRRVTENFCHYWRVVFIWAPLMGLRVKVLRPIGRFLVGLIPDAWTREETREERDARWAKRDAKALRRATSDEFRYRALRAVRGFFGEYGLMIAMGLALIVALAGLVLWGVSGPWYAPFLFLLGVAAFAGMLFLFGYIGSLWNARQERLKELRREARRKADEERWAYFEKHGEFPPVPEPEPTPAWVEFLTDIVDWVGSKIGGFFRGFGQLFVLAGQAIRVNKWKICPFVKIPGVTDVEPVSDEDHYGYLY